MRNIDQVPKVARTRAKRNNFEIDEQMRIPLQLFRFGHAVLMLARIYNLSCHLIRQAVTICRRKTKTALRVSFIKIFIHSIQTRAFRNREQCFLDVLNI